MENLTVSLDSALAKRVIILTDMDMGGSGYMRIASQLGTELVKHGKKVTVLGLSYRGEPHDYPFNIVPVARFSDALPMIFNLVKSNAPLEAVVIALDIPMQAKILAEYEKAQMVNSEIKTVGIFPLEAEPLSVSWATNLHMLNKRLVMTKFGQAELAKYNIDSEFIPVAIDDGTDTWDRRTDEDYKRVRKGLGIADDTFVVLTVADNQERKNLSGAMKIFAKFSTRVIETNSIGFATSTEVIRNAEWHVVTRINSGVGYDLPDLAMRQGVIETVKLYERGLPPVQLRQLYLAADAFLLTSKAEGLGIPMLEAMKIGVPVVATNCTAMAEHAGDIAFKDRWLATTEDRAMMIDPIVVITDPFGNGNRALVNIDSGVNKLTGLYEAKETGDNQWVKDMVDRAYEYVTSRTWKDAGTLLVNTIDELNEKDGTQ